MLIVLKYSVSLLLIYLVAAILSNEMANSPQSGDSHLLTALPFLHLDDSVYLPDANLLEEYILNRW